MEFRATLFLNSLSTQDLWQTAERIAARFALAPLHLPDERTARHFLEPVSSVSYRLGSSDDSRALIAIFRLMDVEEVAKVLELTMALASELDVGACVIDRGVDLEDDSLPLRKRLRRFQFEGRPCVALAQGAASWLSRYLLVTGKRIPAYPVGRLTFFVTEGELGTPQPPRDDGLYPDELYVRWEPFLEQELLESWVQGLRWKRGEDDAAQPADVSHLWMMAAPVLSAVSLATAVRDALGSFGFVPAPLPLDVARLIVQTLAHPEQENRLPSFYETQSEERATLCQAAVTGLTAELDPLTEAALGLSVLGYARFVGPDVELLLELARGGLRVYLSRPGLTAYQPADPGELRLIAHLADKIGATVAAGYSFSVTDVPRDADIEAEIVLARQPWPDEIEGWAYRAQPGSLE
jgi:hypothetical protein